MILRTRLGDGRPKAAALVALLGVFVVCGLLAGAASARTTAAPQNGGAAYSAPGALPPITTVNSTATCPVCGVYASGMTLTAGSGTWAGGPTGFAYQWQRCGTDGTKCANISGATGTTYVLTDADVTHTVTVSVTGVNSDGSSTAVSLATPIVSSAGGPISNSGNWPFLSGTARVGNLLSAHPGPWTQSPTSYVFQWQRCDKYGQNCLNIGGATGQDYAPKIADIGHRIATIVTAIGATGSGSEITINPGLVQQPKIAKKKK
jgi:hypothetical protein